MPKVDSLQARDGKYPLRTLCGNSKIYNHVGQPFALEFVCKLLTVFLITPAGGKDLEQPQIGQGRDSVQNLAGIDFHFLFGGCSVDYDWQMFQSIAAAVAGRCEHPKVSHVEIFAFLQIESFQAS